MSIPHEITHCFRLHDAEKPQVEERLGIFSYGIECGLTPASGQCAMEGYLYNRFPKELDEESKDAIRMEPSTVPSLLQEGVEFPVNSVKWNEWKKKNPDPSTLYPALVMGVDELEARQAHQANDYFEATQRLSKLAVVFKEERE